MDENNLTLTVRQRLNLMTVLRTKGRGKRKDAARRLCSVIFRKVCVPENEVGLYEMMTPAGPRPIADAILRGKDISITLTREEALKLDEVIDKWGEDPKSGESWGPDDDIWLDPLIEQLERIAKDSRE